MKWGSHPELQNKIDRIKENAIAGAAKVSIPTP
jgi:hypothetical protein